MGVVVPFKAKVVIQEIEEEEYEKLLETTKSLDDFAKLNEDELPLTPQEYQLQVKNTLLSDEYEEFCLAVMDIEYYDCLDDDIKELVDTYFTYFEGGR